VRLRYRRFAKRPDDGAASAASGAEDEGRVATSEVVGTDWGESVKCRVKASVEKRLLKEDNPSGDRETAAAGLSRTVEA
jgi:hypothetical protein